MSKPKSKPRPKPKQTAAQVAADVKVREALFVRALAKGYSGARAAREAGFSPKSAAAIASRLLTKSNVSRAVERVKVEAITEAQLTKEWILRRLMRIADANLADFHCVQADGTPRVDLTDATRDQLYALEKIGFEEDGLFALDDDDDEGGSEADIEVSDLDETQAADGKRKATLALSDRLGALKLLGQELGMFRERRVHEIEGVATTRVVIVNDDEDEAPAAGGEGE